MEEVTDLHIKPITCPKENKARMLCISPQCQENSFICMLQSCQICQKAHQACQYYRLSSVIDKIHHKKKNITQDAQKSFKTLQKIYDQAIERLSADKTALRDQREMFGLSQTQATFVNMVNEGVADQVTGKLTSKMIPTINQQFQFNATQQMFQKFWIRRKKQFEKVFDDLKKLCGKKWVPLQSNITDQIDIIQSFFQEPVHQFRLLYRASEHNFSTEKFHQMCDSQTDTLVIAQTQYGKIIGGFTPLQWFGTSGYKQDPSGKSFIFSVSLKKKFKLNSTQYAICSQAGYGPTFGGGHDIYIANNSATADNTSYCNVGHSYNSSGEIGSGQQAYTAFTGTTNSYYVKFKEWEVFKVERIN